MTHQDIEEKDSWHFHLSISLNRKPAGKKLILSFNFLNAKKFNRKKKLDTKASFVDSNT
jgi:hypothetical protein